MIPVSVQQIITDLEDILKTPINQHNGYRSMMALRDRLVQKGLSINTAELIASRSVIDPLVHTLIDHDPAVHDRIIDLVSDVFVQLATQISKDFQNPRETLENVLEHLTIAF